MHNTCTKGDIGLTQVIADLSKKDFSIFISISEYQPFDLIAYKNKISYRIQAKYSSKNIIKNQSIIGKKDNKYIRKKYDIDDFDYYGIYLPSVDKVIYPNIKFGGCTISTQLPPVYGPKFYWYEDFLEFTDEANKRELRDFGIMLDYEQRKRPTTRKVEWPSKEVLEKLLWTKPTTEIAAEFGVSDKAVEKWAKVYNLTKPERGFWKKQIRFSYTQTDTKPRGFDCTDNIID